MTKTMKRILSIGLAVICTAVVGITAIVTNGFNLGGSSPLVQGSVGKLSFGNFLNSGIMLTASADESTDTKSRTTLSDTVRLTATITPELASNQNVDWSIAWKDAFSEWATGKTVTDYVTVTPTADDALTADVKCLQDFGEQVIVTVTSREDTTISASCSVDYKKRYENIRIFLANGSASYHGVLFMNEREFIDQGLISIYDRFWFYKVDNVVFSDYTIDSELYVGDEGSSAYYGYDLYLMVREEVVAAFNEASGKSLKANMDLDRQSIFSYNDPYKEYFDCIYSGSSAISGSSYETLRNEFTTWLRAEEIYDAFYFELQLYDPDNRDSMYFVNQYPVVFTADGLMVSVESLTVDPSNVVF